MTTKITRSRSEFRRAQRSIPGGVNSPVRAFGSVGGTPRFIAKAKGARAMFEGVAIMALRDGMIAEYHEVANTAPAFVDLSFAPERIAKIVAKQGAALKARPEMQRHLGK